jgi:hypothetical protein
MLKGVNYENVEFLAGRMNESLAERRGAGEGEGEVVKTSGLEAFHSEGYKYHDDLRICFFRALAYHIVQRE